MEAFTQILLIVTIWVIGFIIAKSIIIPGPRQIMVIVRFGKLYDVICNINGKKIYKGENQQNGHDKWDVIDLEPGEKGRWLNIYFFLHPIYKPYKYPLTYTKIKRIGEEKPDDIVLWKNEKTKECVVSRSNISNHLEFIVEYPNITTSLDTIEMATINCFTTNVLEIVNPVKMLFRINDWFGLSMQSLSAALRGLVAEKSIKTLNSLASEAKGEYNDAIAKANQQIKEYPGLLHFGLKVIKSIFKDFDPDDQNAKTLMDSITAIEINKNVGEAALEKQKGETAAFLTKTNAEITQEKKRRVETGTAKVDADGKITELVPEANIKVVAENIGKLSNVKGTLVLGNEISNMLNLKQGGGQ